MYDRILVPTDGSTGTAHVVMQALNLADRYGATVHALHVVDTDLSSVLSDVGNDAEELRRRGRRAVETVERMAESHGIDVTTELREGDPAETILSHAEEIGADVIVVGTHGRSGVRRHLLGSVTERLVRHATCPVLTVRLPETDVTVEDADQARALVEDALERRGEDVAVTGIERQQNVWVADLGDEAGRVAYLDPVTQRTSIVSRSG
jgi:nucleotide-binding universal stress UspA family protein